MQLPDCVTQKKLSTQGKCHFINFLGFLTRILHVNFMFNLIHLSLISGGFELISIFTLYIPFCGNSVSIVSISSERNRSTFGSFDPSFNRNILTLLYMKFKTSAYAQIAFILYCASFLTWCEFETYIGDTFDKWSWSMILLT